MKIRFFDLSKPGGDSNAPPVPSRRRTMTWILQRLMAAYLRLLEAAQDANGIRQVPTVAIALPGSPIPLASTRVGQADPGVCLADPGPGQPYVLSGYQFVGAPPPTPRIYIFLQGLHNSKRSNLTTHI